jgi:hypothetical protein
MKAVIVSDSHRHFSYLEKIRFANQDADLFIHCECSVANSHLPRNLFPVAASKGRRSVDEENVFKVGSTELGGSAKLIKLRHFYVVVILFISETMNMR